MKKYLFAVGMAVCSLSLSAIAQVKTSAQEVVPELVKQREEQKKVIVADYINIKNALVVSDAKKAATAAGEFATAFSQFKFKKLTLEEMNAATSARKSIKALADKIAASTSLNDQRKDMEKLSVEFWAIIDKVKPENMPLYQQRCPMMGTTWVSVDKKIENPYYPKNMLTCGEVVAEK